MLAAPQVLTTFSPFFFVSRVYCVSRRARRGRVAVRVANAMPPAPPVNWLPHTDTSFRSNDAGAVSFRGPSRPFPWVAHLRSVRGRSDTGGYATRLAGRGYSAARRNDEHPTLWPVSPRQVHVAQGVGEADLSGDPSFLVMGGGQDGIRSGLLRDDTAGERLPLYSPHYIDHTPCSLQNLRKILFFLFCLGYDL